VKGGSTYAQITGQIASARNGGTWIGSGITSSAAAAAVPKAKTLGALKGSQYTSVAGPTFDGLPVAANDVVGKFTWYGDTDFSGRVDFDDYQRIDNGYQSAGSDWFHGDLNYDGHVDFDDYMLIDLAFNSQNGTILRALRWLGGDGSQDMSDPPLQMVEQHF